ncbi:MAG: GAF domain-containing protein [Anaerolineales bacterium]|nr:GAF domain-containing protein [Anaerolineales bacterium]
MTVSKPKPDSTTTKMDVRRIAIPLGLLGVSMLVFNAWLWITSGAPQAFAAIITNILLIAASASVFVRNSSGRVFWTMLVTYLLTYTAGLFLFSISYYLVIALGTLITLIFILADHKSATPLIKVNFVILGVLLIAGALIFEFLELPMRYPISGEVNVFWFISTLIVTIIFSGYQVRSFRQYNLQTKLIAAFLLVTLLPMSLLTYANHLNTQKTLTAEAQQKLLAIASETASNIDVFLESTLSAVSSEAELPAFAYFLTASPEERESDPMRSDTQLLLRSLAKKDPFLITSYALLDVDGTNVLDNIAVNIGQNESATDYFQSAFFQQTPFVSAIHFSLQSGKFHSIYFSSPVTTPTGELVGVLRVQYVASKLQNILTESTGNAGEESFGILFQEMDNNYLILGNGLAPELIYTTVIPYAEDRLEMLQVEGKAPVSTRYGELALNDLDLFENLETMNQTPFFSSKGITTGGQTDQVAVVRLKSRPSWIMAFYQPESVFINTLSTQTRTSVFLLLAFTMLVIGIAFLAARYLAAPIQTLTGFAQEAAEGNLTVRASVETEDEIGLLAETFNMMIERLDGTITNLEQTVADRTEVLERRSQYLQAAAEVGKAATETYNLDELLLSATQRISERFGFYHVGIFLLDNAGEYAELRAANSEGGWRMLARGHKLAVGQQGVVGFVTGTGQPRIVQQKIETDTVHMQNPDLPLTRSEMALPLISGGEILGALDVQSTADEAFSEEDLTILQVLADQVAMSINNARLIERLQASLESERRVFGQVSSEAWSKLLHTQAIPGYRSNEQGIEPADEIWDNISRQAIEQRRVIPSNQLDEQGRYPLAIPIKIRGDYVIGVVEAHKSAEAGRWTTQEINVLETISEQLGIALENARLFQETQRQAYRERVVADVSGKVWSSTNIESILQTTVQELTQALDLSASAIHLKLPDTNQRDEHSFGDPHDRFGD